MEDTYVEQKNHVFVFQYFDIDRYTRKEMRRNTSLYNKQQLFRSRGGKKKGSMTAGPAVRAMSCYDKKLYRVTSTVQNFILSWYLQHNDAIPLRSASETDAGQFTEIQVCVSLSG